MTRLPELSRLAVTLAKAKFSIVGQVGRGQELRRLAAEADRRHQGIGLHNGAGLAAGLKW